VIAFLGGNSEIGLRQVPYYDYQPSLLSCTRKRRRRQT